MNFPMKNKNAENKEIEIRSTGKILAFSFITFVTRDGNAQDSLPSLEKWTDAFLWCGHHHTHAHNCII